MKFTWIIMIGLLLLNCGSKPSYTSSKIVHPTTINLERNFDNEVTRLDTSLNAFQFDISFLRKNKPITEIGSYSDTSNIILGTVKKVLLDHHNNVYILDPDQFKITVSTVFGEVLDVIGSQGFGPAEFKNLSSFDVADNRNLYVADAHKGISLFKPTKKNFGKFEYIEDIVSDIGIEEISVTKDNIFFKKTLFQINENDSLKGIFKYNFDENSITNSFGNLYISNTADPVFSLSEGMITTLDETMVYSMYFSSFIYGYDISNGETKWITNLPDLEFPKFIETPNAFLIDEEYIDDKASDLMITLLNLTNSLVLIQYANKAYSKNISEANYISSYIIDVNSGKGAYIGNDLPVFKSINNNYKITYKETPYPKLIINE